jgi:hypothetical protein
MSLGAYGFRLRYLDSNESLMDLLQLSDEVPEVLVSWRHACSTVDREEIAVDSVRYGSRHGACLHVERSPPAIRFDLPTKPVPGSLIHPLLTVGIAVLARWRGDVTMHAGAFETSAGAWGIMGSRNAGKSAMLAMLSERGQPTLADDLLTIQDSAIWAGPDCVDLRPDTAKRFPKARYLGVVGGRPRFRLSTPPSRPRAPMRGFFVIDWSEGSSIKVEPLAPKERLEWIYRQEYIPLVGYSDPSQMVPLIALPAWRITRPRDWAAGREVVDRVLEIIDQM